MTDLSLEETAIGDAGLAHLGRLDELRWLNLYRTKVGDAGLAHLKSLAKLEHLPLGETRVTDAGLVHLSGFHRLKYLGLRGDAITDAGLARPRGPDQPDRASSRPDRHHGPRTPAAPAPGPPRVRSGFTTRASAIEAIPTLARLKGLKSLYLYRTNVTIGGVKELAAAASRRCRIYYRSEREPE